MHLSLSWAKSMEGNIDEWIHNGFKRHSDWTSQILNIENNDGFLRLEDSWGPRLISKSGEAQSSPSADRQKGFETVASPQIFKQKMVVSEQYVTRGKYSQIQREAEDLGKATMETLNIFGAQPFIEAFTSTTLFYGDAKPLASSSHTRADGGTAISNTSSTSIPLTDANLETGRINIKQQKGGTGQKLAIGSNLLLMVQEQQEREAVVITGSTRRSGTPNNDLNFYLGLIDTFVNPFIGEDIFDLNGVAGLSTSWFLLARDEHQIIMSYEQRPVFTTWDDEDADTMTTKVKFSALVGWTNPLATYHSKGDNSAYSG